MDALESDRPLEASALTIAVVGSGSPQWAPKLMNDLALWEDSAGEVRLYDLDHDSAAENARLGALVQEQDEAVGDWHYEATDSLVGALDGADVVVCSTQDPPEETMVHDLEVPAEYGVYQTVGDTVGPGGTFRAMRAIPQYREIAAAIRENAPDAWVLNYTNPMSVCTRTLFEEYPDINALGLCHEVYNAKNYLASIVRKHLGVEAEDADIEVNVKGINHFTWVDEVRYQGRDLTDVLDAELAVLEPLGECDPEALADASHNVDNQQITFHLYRRFGVLPAAGDRHLAEFVPWYLNVDDPAAIRHWGIRRTSSEYRLDHWPEGEARRRAYLDGTEPFEFEDTGEKLVDVIRALAGEEPLTLNANLPNRGQIPDLPTGAIVEANARLAADSCTPLAAGSLPRQVRSRVSTHVANQETLVEAGFAGDLDRAYRAFLADPLMTLPASNARALFADMVAAERDYLDAWDLDGAVVLDE